MLHMLGVYMMMIQQSMAKYKYRDNKYSADERFFINIILHAHIFVLVCVTFSFVMA